jgi:phospho-N-acetylmuramoyl-pentapeptide-transferase
LAGWSESKVIVRFWIMALVFALFALTTLKLR